MGWNEIDILNESSKLFNDLNSRRFYFLHSYYLSLDNKNDRIATTNYGEFLTAAVQKEIFTDVNFILKKSFFRFENTRKFSKL